MRAFRSEDEECKLIYSEDDEFVASFAHGEWVDYKVVDITKMIELDPEDDLYDATIMLRQAKKALRPFDW